MIGRHKEDEKLCSCFTRVFLAYLVGQHQNWIEWIFSRSSITNSDNDIFIDERENKSHVHANSCVNFFDLFSDWVVTLAAARSVPCGCSLLLLLLFFFSATHQIANIALTGANMEWVPTIRRQVKCKGHRYWKSCPIGKINRQYFWLMFAVHLS